MIRDLFWGTVIGFVLVLAVYGGVVITGILFMGWRLT